MLSQVLKRRISWLPLEVVSPTGLTCTLKALVKKNASLPIQLWNWYMCVQGKFYILIILNMPQRAVLCFLKYHEARQSGQLFSPDRFRCLLVKRCSSLVPPLCWNRIFPINQAVNWPPHDDKQHLGFRRLWGRRCLPLGTHWMPFQIPVTVTLELEEASKSWLTILPLV